MELRVPIRSVNFSAIDNGLGRTEIHIYLYISENIHPAEILLKEFKKILKFNNITIMDIPDAFKNAAYFCRGGFSWTKSVETLIPEEKLDEFEQLKKAELILSMDCPYYILYAIVEKFKNRENFSSEEFDFSQLLQVYREFKRKIKYELTGKTRYDKWRCQVIEEFLSYFDDSVRLAGECL